MDANIQQQIEQRNHDLRREVLMRRVLHGLRATIQLRPIADDVRVDDIRADFTTDSAAYLAPLIDAVFILEEIIFASDGCVGHRNCMHSMEPWKRARALLQGKWEAYADPTKTWPPEKERP